jgi:hypothetical protein
MGVECVPRLASHVLSPFGLFKAPSTYINIIVRRSLLPVTLNGRGSLLLARPGGNDVVGEEFFLLAGFGADIDP